MAGRGCCRQHRVPHAQPTAVGPWHVTWYSHTPLDTAMMSSTSPWVRPPLAAWGPRKEGRHRQAQGSGGDQPRPCQGRTRVRAANPRSRKLIDSAKFSLLFMAYLAHGAGSACTFVCDLRCEHASAAQCSALYCIACRISRR